MNTYLRVSFIFVLCFFPILLHPTVGVSKEFLSAAVSFYPPRINPGQNTTVTVRVTDKNRIAVHGANVQITAPNQGYFVQTNSRYSAGITDQSGIYRAVWRASGYTSERFRVMTTKNGYNTWDMGYLLIVDDGIYPNQPPDSSGQAKRIKYTISNATAYPINLVFYPSKNTASLAPGQKKSCNSPIRNGEFPAVSAHASNGSVHQIRISKHGCNYKIVHSGQAITIVPCKN